MEIGKGLQLKYNLYGNGEFIFLVFDNEYGEWYEVGVSEERMKILGKWIEERVE